jgi:PAS domain-containing protein
VITSWNHGAEEMYGWTSAEMVGRSVFALVPPEREDELREVLARLARGELVEHPAVGVGDGVLLLIASTGGTVALLRARRARSRRRSGR